MPDFLYVYSESTDIDYDPHVDMIFDSWEDLWLRRVYESRLCRSVRLMNCLTRRWMEGGREGPH